MVYIDYCWAYCLQIVAVQWETMYRNLKFSSNQCCRSAILWCRSESGSGPDSFSLYQVMQPLHGIHTVPSMAPFYTSTHASIEIFHGPPWIFFEPSRLLNFKFDDADPPFLLCVGPDPTFHSDADPEKDPTSQNDAIRISNTAWN
jgi:hypothetical protein